MKHLITGGAGFIGSNLSKKLIHLGYEVICLDDLSCTDHYKIEELKDFKNFSFIKHDVINAYDFDVDCIINLACPASPINYQKDPIQTFKTNIFGSINALNLAKERNIPVIQASTSEIYGDPLEHPQSEAYWGNVNPIGVRSCYDEGKRGAETLFFDYHRKYNIKIKVARLFNTYGPNMSIEDGRAVSNFIVSALKGETIKIYGNGSFTRSFCYVSDTIDALIKLIKAPEEITGPINIGNPTELSIEQLAKK